jgi:hypothetical protein
MYKIELTRRAGWDAPVVEEHLIERALHVGDVERLAQTKLHSARVHAKAAGPTDYRIIDPLGRSVRSSATRSRPRKSVRVRSTRWR